MRLCTYVRDDRSSGDITPPTVWFAYTPDRKGIHPQTYLAKFEGVLQADAYADFNALFDDGTIREAACLADALRKFHDQHAARTTPLTTEALRRIAELYLIETDIRGKPPEERRQVRPIAKFHRRYCYINKLENFSRISRERTAPL